MEIIYSNGEFQYFKVGGRGFIQKGIVNGEFKTCDPISPNINWINSHNWSIDKVIEFARIIKLLGLEGQIDE